MFWLNVLQTTGKSITPLYKKLVLKNVSALTLSMELSIVEPFSLCEAQGAQSSATTKVCQSYLSYKLQHYININVVLVNYILEGKKRILCGRFWSNLTKRQEKRMLIFLIGIYKKVILSQATMLKVQYSIYYRNTTMQGNAVPLTIASKGCRPQTF